MIGLYMRMNLILVSLLLQSASWAQPNTSVLDSLQCSLNYLDVNYSEGFKDDDSKSIPMMPSSLMGQPAFVVQFQIDGINYLASAVPHVVGKGAQSLTLFHAEIIKTSVKDTQVEEFYLKGALVLPSEKDSHAHLISRLDHVSARNVQQIALVCKRLTEVQGKLQHRSKRKP